MMKRILVPLVGTKIDTSALEFAYELARLFDAHIDCLHVRPDPVVMAMNTVGFGMAMTTMSSVLLASSQESVRATAASARRAFDDFCAGFELLLSERPTATGRVSASYYEAQGDQINQVIVETRVREVVVFGRSQEYSGFGQGWMGDVLVGCGRPVLLAATKPTKTFARNVAIAWKNTVEAARAMTAAMPLLVKAHRIAILSAAEHGRDTETAVASAEQLASDLRWHGLSPEVLCITPTADLPTAMMEEAHRFGADLLVMGGYGHSRTREFLLGGFTRHVLQEASLPIFLAH